MLPYSIDIIYVTHKEMDEEKRKEIENNTPEAHVLIPTCQLGKSASINRNYGLENSTSEIFVMMDDDITGFYPGWLTDLVKPLIDNNTIIIASIRCLDKHRRIGSMMCTSGIPYDSGIYETKLCGYKNYKRVPTACLAIRKNDVRFDENFIGSGYEDTAFCNYISMIYPQKRIVINNNCKLIHLNEMQNQGGVYWEHNKNYYLSLFPDDTTIQRQTDWTKYRK